MPLISMKVTQLWLLVIGFTHWNSC